MQSISKARDLWKCPLGCLADTLEGPKKVGVICTIFSRAHRGASADVNSYRTSPLAGGVRREKTKIEAAMAEPLIHRGQLLWVQQIGRERQGDPFGATEQEGVRLFAALAGLAVEKARLVEELEEELTERQRAEIGLRRRTRQVEAVRAISEEITRELDTTTLLSLIAKRAMELLEGNGRDLPLIRSKDRHPLPGIFHKKREA